jgi:hypothetical protein
VAKSKIILPKVAAYFEDKVAGDRVDKIMTQLTSDLQNLKAADTTLVAGSAPEKVSVNGIFFQSFEDDIDGYWTENTAGTLTYPANGQAGGRALRCVGEGFYEFPENMPFNPDTLYRIRCKFRMVTAPTNGATKDLVSVGVQGYAADGTTLVDTAGGTASALAHWYAAADVDMGALALGTWYAYTGYFLGWGATSTSPSTVADGPRAMESTVRYIRPCFRLNHPGGDGTMEIDYISLEVLTEAAEANELLDDVVNTATGKVNTDKVVQDSIQANSISATEIKSNTIIGTNISTLSISGKTVLFDAGSVGGWTLNANYLWSGSVVIDANAQQIRLGSATAPSTGTGIFMGLSGGSYHFRAGNPAANYLWWDGSNLYVAGTLVAAAGTLGTITAGILSYGGSGGVELHLVNRTLKMGATSFSAGTGVFLGLDSGAYKFRVGNPAGEYISFDGTNFDYPDKILNPPMLTYVTLFVSDSGTQDTYTCTWGIGPTVSDATHTVSIEYFRNGVSAGSDTGNTPSDLGDTQVTGDGDGVSDDHYCVATLKAGTTILHEIVSRTVFSAI